MNAEAAGLEFSPDSRRLLAVSKRGVVGAFDLESHDAPEPKAMTGGNNLGLRLGPAVLEPSGDRWLAVTEEGRLACFPAIGREAPAGSMAVGPELQTPPIDAWIIKGPDERSFVAILSPTIRLSPEAKQRSGLWMGRFPHETGSEKALELPGICSSAAFSPDSQMVVGGTWDGRFRVFRSVDEASVGAPIQQEGPVSCLAFDAAGKTVITGSTDRHIRFWDAATGRRVAPGIELQDSIAMLRTITSGDLVAVANDASVALWAAGNWSPMYLRAPIDEPFRRFAISPDGSLLSVSTKTRQLTALRLGRTVVSLADAALWVDLLAPYRLSLDGQHEPITADQRLAAWRRLAR